MSNPKTVNTISSGSYKESTIPERYTNLKKKRIGYIQRGGQFAEWTIPHLFPDSYENEGTNTSQNHDSGMDYHDASWQSLGARAVNHLANKYMMALFPPSRPFFKLRLPDKVYAVLGATTGDSKSEIDFAVSELERTAGISEFEKLASRAAILEALKLLMITGNSLVYVPEKGKVQTYSLYDYVVQRDASGEILEIITIDYKDATTIPQDIRKSLDKYLKDKGEKPKDATYKVYTRIRLKTKKNKRGVKEKRYHVTQAIEGLAVEGESYVKPENLPWLPLVWSRTRREHYGRGLVEEHYGNFKALDVLSNALTEGVIAASDIKWLVDPNSGVNIHDLVHSESGSFHYGEHDSVKMIDASNHTVWQFLENRVQYFEREIGLIFLMNSAATRDAERVTAQEIRIQAQELETSHGGVYSVLSLDLQKPLAKMLVKSVESGNIFQSGVDLVILTGLEALGRSSDVDAIVLWLETLGKLQVLPDPLLNVFKAREFAIATATGYGVDYSEFIVSEEEAEAMAQAQQQQALQQQMMQSVMAGSEKMVGNMDPMEMTEMATKLQGGS